MKTREARSDEKGMISVFVLLTGMILVMLSLSLLTRQVASVKAVQSYEHRVRAHYLAASGMEMVLWQLHQWSEEAVAETLQIHSADTDFQELLAQQVQQRVVHQLYRINLHETQPLENFFSDMIQPHQLRFQVNACIRQETVTIVVEGTYANARVAQEAVVLLPLSRVHTTGLGNEAVVTGMVLQSRSQCLSPWP